MRKIYVDENFIYDDSYQLVSSGGSGGTGGGSTNPDTGEKIYSVNDYVYRKTSTTGEYQETLNNITLFESGSGMTIIAKYRTTSSGVTGKIFRFLSTDSENVISLEATTGDYKYFKATSRRSDLTWDSANIYRNPGMDWVLNSNGYFILSFGTTKGSSLLLDGVTKNGEDTYHLSNVKNNSATSLILGCDSIYFDEFLVFKRALTEDEKSTILTEMGVI